MLQAVIPNSNETFLKNAVVERYNFSKLNKTRIRFKIQLKKTTKSNAPKWADVLKTSQNEQESDLVKVTTSEVGLKGIKVFKALDEAANKLRQEVASVQEWMNYDNGDWICSIDLAPIVWSQLIEIRDNIAPTLRTQLREEYDEGYTDYQERIDKFLSLNAWQLSVEQQQEVKQNLVKAFPCLEELEDYLQVIIGRPVIIPAISEQLSEQQAECLQQITRFIEQYDTNLEQTLRESAIAGGEQLAAQLLEDLSNWEPGRKPVNFKKKMERHFKKVQMLLGNASFEADSSLEQMMTHLEDILENASVDAKRLDSQGRSQLEGKMDEIYAKLLDEQRHLQRLASDEGMGLSKATAMSLKLR
ncbi:hypothetical protein PN465_12020 [Nodularia spumigena CS-584]|uniref:hypothetical protein n=1 Tax=Nodularia spumigena TaxID=70799 RepID=UPI0000EAB81F|nr:hypothetical protein [Nodularia spumigena]AHJ29350.1 hypothetical protein NSP_30230 [Nodularia spumigena CCY9414]EAW45292.1 hypothetical protein N9414_01155 [Nodularia spumigena CCY9414]MDB9382940.1 hypothetical protein [Nodularia spumigena CS-584]